MPPTAPSLSLGPKGRFQIIFWHRTDEGIFAYPEDALAPATKAEVDAAKLRFEDVVAYGTTDLKPTIEKAAASGADAIVLVTAKGFSLDDANVETVVDALRGRPVKVHAISLGEPKAPCSKRSPNTPTARTASSRCKNSARATADLKRTALDPPPGACRVDPRLEMRRQAAPE